MRSPWWHPSPEELLAAQAKVEAAEQALANLKIYIHSRWLRHGGAIDSKQISLNQNRLPAAERQLRVAEAVLADLRERDARYRARRIRRSRTA